MMEEMKMLLSLILLTGIAFAQSDDEADLREALRNGFQVLSAGPPINPIVICDDPPVANDRAAVNSIRTTNQRGCEPLRPNRHRMMERTRYQSGNYLMRNLGNGRYAAVLNLNFQPGPGATPELVASMRARTINCMRAVSPHLTNGNESLAVQIIGPGDRLENDLPRPAENNIVVTPERVRYRGDAGHFGSNFTCRTIAHEILHLLGLCDEYHEGIKKDDHSNGYLDWSCRPVSTSLSYMRNIRVYDEILPQVRRCSCGPECQAIMRSHYKDMYLQMDESDYINSEMSLVGSHINNVVKTGNTTYRETKTTPFCQSRSESMPFG